MILDGSTFRAQQGENPRIWMFARDVTGAGVAGASFASLYIRRLADDYFWQDTVIAFQPSVSSVTVLEHSPTYFPGFYYCDFPVGVTNFTALIQGTLGVDPISATVVNAPFVGEIIVGGWVDDIDASITSRGSAATVDVIKARMGSSFIDDDLTRLNSLYSALRNEQSDNHKELVKKIDGLGALLKE